MKWIYLVMSFMIKRFTGAKAENAHPIEELKELIKENAVKILLVFTTATAIGSFFVAGISITIIDLTSQYDLGENLRLSAVATSGLVMVLLSSLAFIIGLAFATRHDREKKRMEERRAKHHQVNSIQDAIILLVNDYIAEREFNREFRSAQQLQNGMLNSQYRSAEEFERH